MASYLLLGRSVLLKYVFIVNGVVEQTVLNFDHKLLDKKNNSY